MILLECPMEFLGGFIIGLVFIKVFKLGWNVGKSKEDTKDAKGEDDGK